MRDYAALLHLGGEYRIAELHVRRDEWLADRSLAELNLAREGVLVLAVVRPDGAYLGAPRGETIVRTDDVLVIYGPADEIRELDQRRPGTEGDRAHRGAVAEESRRRAEQARTDGSRRAA